MTLNLIRQFTGNGHKCRLALRKAYGEFLKDAIHLIPVVELAPKGLYQFVPQLARTISEWQPTHVITAFSDVALLTWSAMRVAQSRARLIHGVHNTHGIAAMKPGVLGRMRYWLDGWFSSFVYQHTDYIITVSNGIRMEILAHFQIDPDRVVTIPNPVLAESDLYLVPLPRHADTQPYSIVALGRLVRQKGFDVLIDAMAQVPDSWHLDIWGDGPEKTNLQSLITARGLSQSIKLKGYTAEPLEILRRADLFVLPSRHEGLPTALIEALACQCQIVASDCPHGPREILRNGEFGRLVAPDDASALAAALIEIKTAHKVVSSTALLARARDFTYSVAYEKWRKLLEDV